MRHFALGVLLFALCGLSGCPDGPVRMADLEWDPPRLSKEDCPNLSGTYKDRGTLHQVFTVGLQKSLSETSDEEPVARAKVLRNVAGPTRTADEFYARYRAFEQRAILQIRHDPDVLQAVLMDEAGGRLSGDYSKTRYTPHRLSLWRTYLEKKDGLRERRGQ